MEKNDATLKNKENKRKKEKRKKENTAIKNRVIEYIRNLFRMKKENYGIKITKSKTEYERHQEPLLEGEENYYTPARVCNVWSNKYIEYESNGDINKILSVKEYLNKTKSFLKNIINDLKKCDTLKI